METPVEELACNCASFATNFASPLRSTEMSAPRLAAVSAFLSLGGEIAELSFGDYYGFGQGLELTRDSLVCLAKSLPRSLTSFRLYNVNTHGKRKLRVAVASGVAEVIRHCDSLECLDLSHTDYSMEGILILAQALGSSENLAEFHFAGNWVGLPHLGILLPILANRRIAKLDLWKNYVDDAGVSFLVGRMFPAGQPASLRELNLGRNAVSDEGAKHLAEALTRNRTLRVLYLGDNEVTDRGATLLAEMLCENHLLEVLGLWTNQVGDVGAKELARALSQNKGLRRLFLAWNCIGDEGGRAMIDGIARNKRLAKLQLNGNLISEAAKAEIRASNNTPGRGLELLL